MLFYAFNSTSFLLQIDINCMKHSQHRFSLTMIGLKKAKELTTSICLIEINDRSVLP